MMTLREPFGLVTMLESMALGTSVIAMNLGSMPKVVVDGVSGDSCDSVAKCIAAVSKVTAISRSGCRFGFGVGQRVVGYEAVYRQLLVDKSARNEHLVRVIQIERPIQKSA